MEKNGFTKAHGLIANVIHEYCHDVFNHSCKQTNIHLPNNICTNFVMATHACLAVVKQNFITYCGLHQNIVILIELNQPLTSINVTGLAKYHRYYHTISIRIVSNTIWAILRTRKQCNNINLTG